MRNEIEYMKLLLIIFLSLSGLRVYLPVEPITLRRTRGEYFSRLTRMEVGTLIKKI